MGSEVRLVDKLSGLKDHIECRHLAYLECEGCSARIEEESEAWLTDLSDTVDRLATRALEKGWALLDDGSDIYWGCPQCARDTPHA